MAVVAIVSVLVVGIYNLVTARDFLNSTVEAQLVSVGQSRMQRLERGVESIGDIVVTIADGRSVALALEDLNAGYVALGTPPTAAELGALEAFYQEGIAEAVPPGYEVPPVDVIFPASDTPNTSSTTTWRQTRSRIDPSWMMPATARTTAPPMRFIIPL